MQLEERLVALARQARENAYCPYSGFAVGAALLGASGRLYIGVNCENASYGGTICAERAALTAAVAAGERRFRMLAIAAGDTPTFPCGLCRQTLWEFGDMDVVCAPAQGEERVRTRLSALLPDAFGPAALREDG